MRTKCGCISNPGSPPQVRGKRCKKYCRNATFGITPAGAGKTRTVRMLCCGCRDHPRRCGENASSGCPRGMNLGSPPQVRGKPSCCVTFLSFFRITPAGAGKTAQTRIHNGLLEDHPRRCGENKLRRNPTRHTLGSPPQVRGKLFLAVKRERYMRITPAGAGKTKIFSAGSG